MRPYLLATPAAALAAGFLLGPLVLLARVSLYEPAAGRGFYAPATWTAANYAALADGYGLRLVAATAVFAAAVAAASVGFAFGLALFLRTLSPGLRRAGVGLVLLPKLASPLVLLFGLQQLLGPGWNRGPAAAVAGEVLLVAPYLVLVLFVQLGNIDPALPAAARGLGATRGQVFRRVTLPLCGPGLVLAAQLGLVWGAGAFLGPLLLGGPDEATLAVEAHRQAFEYGRWPLAAADAVVLLALAGVLFFTVRAGQLVGRLLTWLPGFSALGRLSSSRRRGRGASPEHQDVNVTPRDRPTGPAVASPLLRPGGEGRPKAGGRRDHLRRSPLDLLAPVAPLLGWLPLAALLAPVGYAAWLSFSPGSFLTPPTRDWSLRWYAAFLDDPRWLAALGRSAGVAAGAAGIAVLAGVPLAIAVARHHFRGRTLAASIAVLPACVPPAALGVGLLPVLYAAGLWGHPLGLLLAHGLLGLPVVFLIAKSKLTQLDPALEAAAHGLGASAWQTARRVTLPLVRPAVLAGGAAAVVVSLNEGLVTIFLATPDTETLPAVVWPQLRYAASPLVAVASVVGTLAAAAGAVAAGRWVRGR
jgi:putative spermidine/putrescine transport system permease protein